MAVERFFPEGTTPRPVDDKNRSILKWLDKLNVFTPVPPVGAGLEIESGLLVETEGGQVIEVTQ